MLEAAISRTSCTAGLIVHSDQGWHYKMQPYRVMLARREVKHKPATTTRRFKAFSAP